MVELGYAEDIVPMGRSWNPSSYWLGGGCNAHQYRLDTIYNIMGDSWDMVHSDFDISNQT